MVIIPFGYVLQGCTIYKKQPSTMEQAIESNLKVKIIFNNGNKMNFNQIEMEDGIIYGLNKIHGEPVKTIIPKDQIKEIHIKNKGASTGTSIVLGIGVSLAIITAIGAISLSNGIF